MWSMANPAITEHIFNSPVPILAEYDFTIELDLVKFNSENLSFQTASYLTGSYMGTYGLSSMLFALILTIYTSKRRINRKMIHLFSLILGGIGRNFAAGMSGGIAYIYNNQNEYDSKNFSFRLKNRDSVVISENRGRFNWRHLCCNSLYLGLVVTVLVFVIMLLSTSPHNYRSAAIKTRNSFGSCL